MAKKKPEPQEQPIDPIMDDDQEQDLDPVEVAAQTMLGDLMKMTIDLAKALPTSWQELSESQQDMWINSVEAQCRTAIRHVVQIIASEGCARIPVQIRSCTIKDSVVVQVEMLDGHQVIEMVSADSKTAILVLANSDNFISDNGKPKAEKDQRALDLGHEYTDGDGDGMAGNDDTDQ
jgi:hypothetical protein